MKYEIVSHRVRGFSHDQLRQFERQVERSLGENGKPLGAVDVTELPNGYQLTQAVLVDDAE